MHVTYSELVSWHFSKLRISNWRNCNRLKTCISGETYRPYRSRINLYSLCKVALIKSSRERWCMQYCRKWCHHMASLLCGHLSSFMQTTPTCAKKCTIVWNSILYQHIISFLAFSFFYLLWLISDGVYTCSTQGPLCLGFTRFIAVISMLTDVLFESCFWLLYLYNGFYIIWQRNACVWPVLSESHLYITVRRRSVEKGVCLCVSEQG